MNLWNSNAAAASAAAVRSGNSKPPTKATTTAAWMVAVALSYYLTARLGLLIPYVGTHVSLVWLPTGIAIAALSRLGPAMLPAVFVGGMCANATIGGPLWMAAAVGVGNAMGPWVSVRLLRRWGFDDRLLRRKDMVAFIVAVSIGMTLTASNGTSWLRAGGALDQAHWAGAWLSWWIGDSVGAILGGIPLVAMNRGAIKQSFLSKAGAQDLVLQGIVLLCGLAVFSTWLPPESPLLFPLLALPFFLIAVLALHSGVLSSSLAVLLLSMSAAWGTARGLGPFAGHDAHAGILALWSYITAQAFTSLLICGVATELQSSRRQFSALFRHSQDGIVMLSPEQTLVTVNPTALAMLGLKGARAIGRPVASLPHGNGLVLEHWLDDHPQTTSGDIVLSREGTALHVECQVTRFLDASGYSQTYLTFRDLTARKIAEAKLSVSEARLNAIADNLPAMIAYVDRTETYRYANAHFRQVMKIEPEHLVGQTMEQFLGSEAHAELRPEIDGALRGERRKFERTGWKHNASMHFIADYVPDVGADGSVAGFFIMVLDITHRRQAELALARSEARIRTIADNLPAMISHFDKDRRYTFANARVGKALGLDAASLIGQPIAEVWGEQTYAHLEANIATALSGAAVSFETSTYVNGRQEFIEANYVPEIDASGRVLGFYALTFEVTRRKLAEDKLRESQQMLDRTGTIAGVGGWEVDMIANTVRWTTQTRRIHEVDDDFVPTFENAVDFYVGEARDRIQETIQRSIESRVPWDVELPLRTAKGRSIWVRATGEVEIEHDRPVRMFGAFQDVTDRVTRENRLREQTELLQVTLKSIGDGVITTDDNGRIQWMNPVAERMTGWLSNEAEGSPLRQVFHLIHAETRAVILGVGDTNADHSAEATASRRSVLVSRNGFEYAIEDSASPIRGADGTTLGSVLVFHDVSEQRRLSDQMTHRATHDELTGLVNRADFESRLARVLAKTVEDGSSALMYIDLDQFKLVNDACGHAMGDKLLKQVSSLLSESVRARDTLARLGGDEFGVILEHCTVDQAQRVAQTICDRMDEFRFVHEGRRFRIGASVGLVPIDSRWLNQAALLQAADTACYAAKEAGRNRVHVWFDTDQAVRAREGQTQWGSRLESALDDGRFVLYAQQIQSIQKPSSGLHCEVLLRLREPDGTIIAPGSFLPAAERFHMASRIDRWVVRSVFEWLAAEGGSPGDIETIAVNLSGQSIGDRAFHRFVVQLLEEIPIDARKLCFEITETAAITNLADATAFIESIRLLGMRVALDDFGAGASSFGYLKNLPVDYLKIDGQFVRDINVDELDMAAVRCFKEVAKVVGVETIAEFVETDEILASIREIGIDYAQGYLFHRPEPMGELVARIRAAETAQTPHS